MSDSSLFDLGDSGNENPQSAKFINPFCDIASTNIPDDIKTLFEFCEYLMLAVVPFRSISQRVVRYFLTNIELTGVSDNEIESCKLLLEDKLDIINELAYAGDNYMTYGQSFVSIYFPFERFLICGNCGINAKADIVDYTFNSKDVTFAGKCKACGEKVSFEVSETRSLDLDRVKLIHWNPKNMDIKEHPISGKTQYYYTLSKKFVKEIKDGNKFYLNDTPMNFIKTCCKNTKGSVTFRFDDDALHVTKCQSLAGLELNGWAIPPILPNFKLAYYIQLLRRYDEAIALDHIIPDRVIFPDVRTESGGMDALITVHMETFTQQTKEMVERRRKNPFSIQVSPFRIGQVTLGGDAKALTPKDSIAYAMDELMNSLGYPSELYTGSLRLDALPVALRIFEKQWGVLVEGSNRLLNFVAKSASKWFGWGKITAKLRSVTLADDIERKALVLQAAAGRDITKGTAYKTFGIDYLDEQRKVFNEEEEIAKLQREFTERQERLEQTPDGEQSGQGQTGTPGDINAEATQIAQSLLFEVPESLRRGELSKIKASNPTLHALVLQKMDETRREMARQGQAMIMQEQKHASDNDKHNMTALDSLPSPLRLQLTISDQLTEYSRSDLQKIAMDIKRGVKGSKEAFSFIYGNLYSLL